MQHKATQRAILALALDSHPEPLTAPRTAREIGADKATADAIAELVRAGLIVRDGDRIKPSAASLHFDALELP